MALELAMEDTVLEAKQRIRHVLIEDSLMRAVSQAPCEAALLGS